MKTQLYKYDGTPLFEVIVDDTSSQDWSLMRDNQLSVSFELEECVVLTAGCYIDFDDTRFYLLNEYKPTMICSSAWKYDLTLGDAASWLSITLALKTIDGENTPLFKYTGPAAEHAAIIVANLNRRMGTDQWKVGSVISTENIAIDYSGKYCSDVLQEIVDAKNTEWWIDGMTLNIGRAEFGESVTLGYMNGVLGDIVCDTAGDMRSYAYLFPIGSTRNIDPTKYGHDRLQLPSGLKSVPINPEQGVAELVEEAAFAHIYPRYEGTVSAVRYTTAKNEDGTSFLIYYIKDTAIPFNPNEFEIPGLVKHITFQSGELMGQEFEVNYSADSNEFELITRWTGDIQLPGGVLVPAVGDKYVVWNISMPDVYYTIASHELLDAARAYAADAIKDVSVYKVKLDYIDVQERGLKLRPGQRVRLLSNEYFASGHYDSRITRITRNIAYPDELSVDISAVRVVGTLSRLQASIQKTENVVAQFSGQLPAIIKSNDDTSADDSSVYTSAKSEKEFLNKRKGGRVAAPVTFDEVTEFLNGLVAHKYIKVGNGYLKYNDELGVWEITGDLFVTGNFAWGSSIDGFKPSTVMDSVRVDDSTIIKKKDSNGDWYLYAPGGSGGGSGGGLTLGDVVSYLSDNDYTTKTDVNSLIASSLGGYATQSWVAGNYLSSSGGTISGDLSLNQYLRIKARAGYGSGSCDMWYNGNNGILSITAQNITNYFGDAFIHSGNIGSQSVNYATNADMLDNFHASDLAKANTAILSGSNINHIGYGYPMDGNVTVGPMISYGADSTHFVEIQSYFGDGTLYYRNHNENGYGPVKVIAFTDSNVASATKLQTARTIWGQSFDGTGNITGYLSNVSTVTFVNTNRGLWQGFQFNSALTGSDMVVYGDTICLYGNVAVGGITADAKLHVHGTNAVSDAYASGLLIVGESNGTHLAIDGNDIQAKSNANTLSTLYLNGWGGDVIINESNAGKVGIGTTNPTVKFHIHYSSGANGMTISRDGDECSIGYVSTANSAFVAGVWGNSFNIWNENHGTIASFNDGGATINGNLLVNGNVSWFSHSQRSLKNIVSEQGLSLAQLERIKPIKFYWKDGRDMALHVGGVADVFAEVLPEVVARNLQDILCLNYVDAAFYVGASLIAPVLDHERRITKGEEEQEALKKENAKLKRELEEVKSKLNHLAA